MISFIKLGLVQAVTYIITRTWGLSTLLLCLIFIYLFICLENN